MKRIVRASDISHPVGYQPDVSARKKINYVSRALLISRSWHIKGAAKIVCLQNTGLAGTVEAPTELHASLHHLSTCRLGLPRRKSLAGLTVRRN